MPTIRLALAPGGRTALRASDRRWRGSRRPVRPAVPLLAFRHAALTLDPVRPESSAIISVAVVQTMQAFTLTTILLVVDPGAVRAVLRGWRPSLAAGLCGTCASSGWFVALTARSYTRVRRVARTIADLAGRETVTRLDVAEALSYRRTAPRA